MTSMTTVAIVIDGFMANDEMYAVLRATNTNAIMKQNRWPGFWRNGVYGFAVSWVQKTSIPVEMS